MRTATVYARARGVASSPCWGWMRDDGDWRIGPYRGRSPLEAGLAAVLDVLAATSGPLEIRCDDAALVELLAGSAPAPDADDAVIERVRRLIAEQDVRVRSADEADLAGVLPPEAEETRPGRPAPAEVREAVIAQETALLGSQARRDPDRLEQLIHPDFDEIGRTGKSWERDEVIRVLQTVPDQTHAIRFGRVIELAPGVAHVRFITEDARGVVHRSSIWLREGGLWRQRYHQGTPDTQDVSADAHD